MVHTHNWGDHPPDGPLSWEKTWDEKYFDTEALSENSEVKSEDFMLDTLYTLELDPNFRFNEELWPEVVEWCSSCREHRRVKFVNKKVLAKVQALDGVEDEVLSRATLEEDIESEVKKEMDTHVREELVTKIITTEENVKEATKVVVNKVLEEDPTVELMVEKVLVEETSEVEVIARSTNFSLRQASTPTMPLSAISPSTSFWRPWEDSCEATAVKKPSGEATTQLSSEGVTPPSLVTPPRERVYGTGRKVGRRLQRLLTFQSTLTKEKGLPPSRWQRRLEFGEEGEATFLSTPVSHRRKKRRRGGVPQVETSTPQLREDIVEDRGTPSHHAPWFKGLEASRHNKILLHSALQPGVWDGGGGQRGFCYGCRLWGNMVLLV